MAIKISLNKLDLTQELPKVYENAIRADFEILPIHSEAIFQLATLPMHHRDPFDRLLISTALNQSLPLVIKDQQFQAYQSLNILWY